MELVDRANSACREPFAKLEDLSVIGRDDENIRERDRTFHSFGVDPSRARSKDLLDDGENTAAAMNAREVMTSPVICRCRSP